MIFTSFSYLYYFLTVFIVFWFLRRRTLQNTFLLLASYLFYGWIHPWFCIIIALATIVGYACALAMQNFPQHKKLFLSTSLICNLGILGIFKYSGFFIENISIALNSLGLPLTLPILKLVLPLGISFYTFQILSYSIDVYRGILEPRKNLVDFALYVSFFPQLLAGPIGRASSLIPQLEVDRSWDWDRFHSAWPLIIRGLFKKLVIADNLIFYVDKVYMLQHPDFFLFLAGTLAFTVQIYTDFSGYTDIARGCARLLGIELMVNFNNPYLACSPSDFWRRWHISLSTWIRDYLFIPMGGSRHKKKSVTSIVILVTMLLCGLWHGPAWNFVVWGGYHGALIVLYRLAGFGSKWKPNGTAQQIIAIGIMFCLTNLGWSIFRASSMDWYLAMWKGMTFGFDVQAMGIAAIIVLNVILYTIPLVVFSSIYRLQKGRPGVVATCCSGLLLLILVFHTSKSQDFIYFQF